MNNKIKLLSIAIGLTLFVAVSIPVLTNSGINPEHDPLPAIPFFPMPPHPDPGLGSEAAIAPEFADSAPTDDQYASVILGDDIIQATEDKLPVTVLVDPELPLVGEPPTSTFFTLLPSVLFAVGVFVALVIVLRTMLIIKRERFNAKLQYISDHNCDSESLDNVISFEKIQSLYGLNSDAVDNERDTAC